jgi:elongation factor 1-alpha
MKFRLNEGNGMAFYRIGVKDEGDSLGISMEEMRESLATLFIMAHNLDAVL